MSDERARGGTPEQVEEELRRQEPSGLKQNLFYWLQALVVALVALTVVFTFFGRIVVVVGHSMDPTLNNGELLIQTGILSTKEEEVRLYRIMDVTLRRSLGQRLFGLGTIHCCSADKSTPEFDIKWIPNSAAVKEKLSDLVEAERMAKRVSSREFMSDEDDGEDVL